MYGLHSSATILRSGLCAAAFLLGSWAAHTVDAAVAAGPTFIEVDGQASMVLGISGGYRRIAVAGGGALTGLTTPVTARVPMGISKAFSDWLNAAVSGGTSKDLAVVRTSNAAIIDRIFLKSPKVIDLNFRAPAEQGHALEMRATIHVSQVDVLGALPLGAVTQAPHAVTGSRITSDGISVTPLNIEGIGWRQPTDPQSGLAIGKPVCNAFRVIIDHSDIAGMYDWYTSSLQMYRGSTPPPARKMNWLLVDRAGRSTPLASLTGVIMTAFEPFNDVDGTMKVRTEFLCDSITLTFEALR